MISTVLVRVTKVGGKEVMIENDGTTISKVYNRFVGSLEPLKNMSKLEVLSIYNTNIDSGLEYLPDSLEVFYCAASKKEPINKVRIIEQILRGYGEIEEGYNFANRLKN